MWRSVVTCIPVQIQPISKRSQHTIEDIQAFEQEQLVHDPTSYNRQVLPNIRRLPKSKFIYKGLAYKEVKKIPGVNVENVDNAASTHSDPLKKPLVDYNLAQAYIRYEVNAERTKQVLRQPTLPPTVSTKNQPLTKTHTSLDLREIRKRIVKGTTLPYRPTPQSAQWAHGRTDNKSAMSSEVHLSARCFTALNRVRTAMPYKLTSAPSKSTSIHVASS